MPDKLKDTFMEIYWRSERHLSDIEKKFDMQIARDGSHHGPNSHYHYANNCFKWLESYNIIKGLL